MESPGTAWIFPVLPDVGCVWTVSPAERVSVGTDKTGERLLYRRLLLGTKRLHIAFVGLSGFRDGGSCLASLSDQGQTGSVELTVRLADWSAPHIDRVLRILPDAVGQISPAPDLAPFLRFLSTIASWRVKAVFARRFGASWAVLLDLPATDTNQNVPAVFLGDSRLQVASIHGRRIGRRYGFVWKAKRLKNLFIGFDDELVELSPPSTASPSEQDVFDGLSAGERSEFVEMMAEQSGHDDVEGMRHLADLVRTSCRYPTTLEGLVVKGLFGTEGASHLVVEGDHAEDQPLQLSLQAVGQAPVTFSHCATFTGNRNGQKAVSFLTFPVADDVGLFRISASGRDAYMWAVCRDPRDGAAASLLRELSRDDLLEAGLLEDLYWPAPDRRTRSHAPDLWEGPGRDAPIVVVCLDPFKSDALRQTLISIALTVADNVGIEVLADCPNEALFEATKAVRREFKRDCRLTPIRDGMLGMAVSARLGARDFNGTILLRAGSVPRDPHWYGKATEFIRRSGRSIGWAGPSGRALASVTVVDCATDRLVGAVSVGKQACEDPAPFGRLASFDGLAVGLARYGRERKTLVRRQELSVASFDDGAPSMLEANRARMDQIVLRRRVETGHEAGSASDERIGLAAE